MSCLHHPWAEIKPIYYTSIRQQERSYSRQLKFSDAMNLKSPGIVTLHAYLPPQHAVKAKSAPVCFDESGCKITTLLIELL